MTRLTTLALLLALLLPVAPSREAQVDHSLVGMPPALRGTAHPVLGGPPSSTLGPAALSLRGWATYCAPTPTHCQRWGGDAHLGAVPSFRYGDKPYRVTVTSGGRSTTVTVTSFCACGPRRGTPTVIDLSPAAFADLAPLSRGVIAVTIRAAGPPIRLPDTSTEGSAP